MRYKFTNQIDDWVYIFFGLCAVCCIVVLILYLTRNKPTGGGTPKPTGGCTQPPTCHSYKKYTDFTPVCTPSSGSDCDPSCYVCKDDNNDQIFFNNDLSGQCLSVSPIRTNDTDLFLIFNLGTPTFDLSKLQSSMVNNLSVTFNGNCPPTFDFAKLISTKVTQLTLTFNGTTPALDLSKLIGTKVTQLTLSFFGTTPALDLSKLIGTNVTQLTLSVNGTTSDLDLSTLIGTNVTQLTLSFNGGAYPSPSDFAKLNDTEVAQLSLSFDKDAPTAFSFYMLTKINTLKLNFTTQKPVIIASLPPLTSLRIESDGLVTLPKKFSLKSTPPPTSQQLSVAGELQLFFHGTNPRTLDLSGVNGKKISIELMFDKTNTVDIIALPLPPALTSLYIGGNAPVTLPKNFKPPTNNCTISTKVSPCPSPTVACVIPSCPPNGK